MPKTSRPKTSTPKKRSPSAARPVGRPARPPGRARRQIVVDTALLTTAMRLTGRGQSETVNVALAQLAENAAILEGVNSLVGAFPNFPDLEGDEER